MTNYMSEDIDELVLQLSLAYTQPDMADTIAYLEQQIALISTALTPYISIPSTIISQPVSTSSVVPSASSIATTLKRPFTNSGQSTTSTLQPSHPIPSSTHTTTKLTLSSVQQGRSCSYYSFFNYPLRTIDDAIDRQTLPQYHVYGRVYLDHDIIDTFGNKQSHVWINLCHRQCVDGCEHGPWRQIRVNSGWLAPNTLIKHLRRLVKIDELIAVYVHTNITTNPTPKGDILIKGCRELECQGSYNFRYVHRSSGVDVTTTRWLYGHITYRHDDGGITITFRR